MAISPVPSPVKVNVDGMSEPLTFAENDSSSFVLSISLKVKENKGFSSNKRLFSSRFVFETIETNGGSFTGLTVIVTVLFLVILFSTAVTENEN